MTSQTGCTGYLTFTKIVSYFVKAQKKHDPENKMSFCVTAALQDRINREYRMSNFLFPVFSPFIGAMRHLRSSTPSARQNPRLKRHFSH